ncbi:NAD-dependent epimerase/dehydratase family protein [Nocardia sp. SYP-A9097]|uniref:NAD-dependent epimerase/dehydratase family protein n=1 Tax=Nocardia sp. SYP-A9097 TaxID=2663237 RepID=UPI00132C031C|nr:NAD-dependent epimerase/dehydratase family protein [Nocardia sp. SYP-A9097]MRH93593.1 NAD-dependent epimerase/dehydratase family protein [Nocardia sp. SYP-A9097]
MEIVGNGFLATHLRRLEGRHADTVALAAGVSTTAHTARADFAREAELVAATAARCRATGRRLLFFSTASSAVYRLVDGPGREDGPVVSSNPYGAHKLSLEQRVRAEGVDYLTLRLGHIVGPGQPPHQLVPALVRQILDGEVGVQRWATRDLLGVDDAVTIIDQLLDRDLRAETVNVASGTAVPIDRIVDHLEARLDRRARRRRIDAGEGHVVSVRKLRSYVPVTGTMFGPGYYRRVLDAYLGRKDRG